MSPEIALLFVVYVLIGIFIEMVAHQERAFKRDTALLIGIFWIPAGLFFFISTVINHFLGAWEDFRGRFKN